MQIANSTSSKLESPEMSVSMGTWGYLNNFLVQESIALMFVALGLAIIGIGYARLKTPEFLKLHRWMMSSSVILGIIAIAFVMFPSLYLYYVNGGSFTSGFNILQIVHSVVGFPAVVLGLMYVFNRFPQPTKKWMQIAAVLWIASIVLGAVVYYTMPS
jgi:uncharacterized membrane protein YozB (DUF420 family)